ncbi:MAG: GntR family transcriptional regulator [Lentisphaerae bacterium]|jgi:DNA-binding LacI/PurR family transcriptional regulator|nr:GntR family transcriptional regulator [Lentisphaerota bacterium]
MIEFNIDRNAPSPVYIQIRDRLEKVIRSGKYPPLSAIPPVAKIAEMAGVSLRTADLAMTELVRDGICFRRRKKGTFVSETCLRQKQQVCAIFASSGTADAAIHPLTNLLYRGIIKSTAKNGMEAVVLAGDAREMFHRYERSEEFELKGAIVIDQEMFSRTIELAECFPDKKFVFLNYLMKDMDRMPPNMYAVINNDFDGAVRLIENLIFNGLEKFTILTMELSQNDLTYQERVRGFQETVRKYSPLNAEIDIVSIPKYGTIIKQSSCAFFAIRKMLHSGKTPQAICCVNDNLARGAQKALLSEGLLPQVKITGYDGLFPVFDDLFATAKIPYEKMGETAVQMILGDEKPSCPLQKLDPEILAETRGSFLYT